MYAANKPLSYRVMAEVAAAGAMLHVEGLDENNMSKMTSRSAATMHDQQNHLIQRTCARETIGHSPKIVQWDEGTKRGKAWVAAAVVASRESGDGSRLREVSKSKCRDRVEIDCFTITIFTTTLLLFLLYFYTRAY